jgi:plastocyanin
MNENIMNDDAQVEMPKGEKKSNLLAILGVVAIVAIVAFVMIQANSGSNTPATVTPSPTPTPEAMEEVSPTPTEEEVAPVEEVVEIDMEAGNFSFSPDEITVKLGQTVRITLTANDMQHNFSLEEFDVDSEIVAEGESTTIEFLADQVGEFEFYCGVGNHRAQGQVGTLIVEE